MRMSLRGMLIGVALVALAIASLTYANDVWLALITGLTMVALFVVLIISAVDRGERQALAIGFGITIIAYGAVLMTGGVSTGFGRNSSSKNIEFDPWDGRLPTTRLLRYVHQAVDRGGYFDVKTGNYIPDYDPATDPMQTPQFGGGSGFGGGGGGMPLGPSARFRELPPREFFMPIGHCWWALLLGYAGGLFAQHVYRRREKSAGGGNR